MIRRRLIPRTESDLVRTPEAAPRELDRLSRRPLSPPTSPPTPQRQPPTRPTVRPKQARSARETLLRDLSSAVGVRRAILLSEILGPPVALREPPDPRSG